LGSSFDCKRSFAVSEDEAMNLIKASYAIYVSAVLVQLAYDGWVLRVLFGCKRYFEDKTKAKIMNSTYAAPHSKA
jgi:hypothetical protein